MRIRAGLNMDAVRTKKNYQIKVNGNIINEHWNNFRSWYSAVDYLSENYGVLVGISFLMDKITVCCVEENEYEVKFS